MDNERKLSHVLLDIGFFSALGTSEHPGGQKEGVHVKRGTPLTYDSNNGTVVVYDEEGRPWITRFSSEIGNICEDLRRSFSLQHGAFVPHSNDGGNFVRNVIPNLR